MMLKPKKPPDPSQFPLLCSSLPSLPSVSLHSPSLSLTPARSFVLNWTLHRFSLAPFSRLGQLLACIVSTAIKRHLIASLTTLFERCSSLSKVLDATFGSITPDRSPFFLPIRTRSRSVCLPAVSRFSAVAVVTDLIIQTRGSLHEADGAALLNRPGSSLEQPKKQPPEQSHDCFRRNSPQAAIPMNGSRFALVAGYCHNWQDRSVCIASCCSIVHSQTQVCYPLPLHFFIVLMDSLWAVYSNALPSTSSQYCGCWTGVLSLTWPWSSLRLNWPVGVDELAVTELWFCRLHMGTSKLWGLLVWKPVAHGYGLVFPQRRPSGSVSLFLNFFMVDILAPNPFTVGVCVLLLRLFLYHLYWPSIIILLHRPTRMVSALFMAHGNFSDYLFWIPVALVHYTLRMLLVLISLELSQVSSLLPTLLEGALEYQKLSIFMLSCSWYLRNFSIDLWAFWSLLDCFHLDQCVYVLGMRPWMIVLPCSVYWISLARVTLCIVYSGVLSRAILFCNYQSMLLSLVAAMVLVRCARMHVRLVRPSTAIILMTLSPSLTAVWVTLTLSCGWLLTNMMRFLSSTTTVWVAVFEFWGLPLPWLSLPLERLSAIRQDPLRSRFCWQLPAFQIGRDEVTGMTLFVDEDLLSETSLAIYFNVSRGVCRVVWCLLAQVLGPGTPGCCEGQSRLVVYIKSSSAPDNSVVSVQFLISCHIAMYWSFDVMISCSSQMAFQIMIVVDRVQCIDNHSVNCISGSCTPSVSSRNFSFIRILEQHLCVLGLCLMALEAHPWMPSPAHYGCCLFRCCALLHSYRAFILAMQISRCALKSLMAVCMEFFFASLWFKGYVTNCLQ